MLCAKLSGIRKILLDLESFYHELVFQFRQQQHEQQQQHCNNHHYQQQQLPLPPHSTVLLNHYQRCFHFTGRRVVVCGCSSRRFLTLLWVCTMLVAMLFFLLFIIYFWYTNQLYDAAPPPCYMSSSRFNPSWQDTDDVEDEILLHHFNDFFAGMGSEEWEDLVRSHVEPLKITKGAKVIDIGCGTGAFLQTLQKLYEVQVTGIEQDPLLYEYATQNLNGTVYLADPKELDFLDPAQFDYVFSFNLFQYLTTKHDVRWILYNMARLAKLHAPIFVGFVNEDSTSSSSYFRVYKENKPTNCGGLGDITGVGDGDGDSDSDDANGDEDGDASDYEEDTDDVVGDILIEHILIKPDLWKDLAWEFALEDIKLVRESQIQNRGSGWLWRSSSLSSYSSSYQYSVYCRKGGIIHG